MCSFETLQERLQKLNLTIGSDMLCFNMISTFFETTYGTPVALALRKSPWPILDSFSVPDYFAVDDMPWLAAEVSPWMSRLPCKLLIGRLKSCLQSMHPSLRPLYKNNSKQLCWNTILRHLKQRGCFLCQDDKYLLEQLLSTHLSHSVTEFSCTSIVRELLVAEYGKDILDELSRPILTQKQSINACVKLRKTKQKMQERMTTFKLVNEIRTSWPHKISHEIIFKRLNEYLEGTLWTLPPPCAVCSRQIHETSVTSLIVDGDTSALPHHLDMLIINDPFVIQTCIVQCNLLEFTFSHKSLDGLMLYKPPAIHLLPNGDAHLDICKQCHSSLLKSVMPKFALANDLYRGPLPEQFSDLTWVEEMVCARFRYTAYITRLFQSSDPALPNVLHGNTCVHEMNVVSTASVLPRAPADVNNMLSVVFIGPGKF